MQARGVTAIVIAASMSLTAGCAGGAAGGTGAIGAPAGEVPVVQAPADAPTVIDVPAPLASAVVGPTGGSVTAGQATLVVPDGVVAADTEVVTAALEAPFMSNPYAADEEGAAAAVPANLPVDFGPAGVQFDSPVEVTMSYDPALVDQRFTQPVLVYWTGTRWSVLGGAVDTAAHTVSAKFTRFDGSLLAVAIGTGVGMAVNSGLRWYFGSEAITSDPISTGRAAQYVQPTDKRVVAAAKQARVGGIELGDEAALASHLEGLGTGEAPIVLVAGDGSSRTFKYSTATGSNWQEPGDYFAKSPTGTTASGAPALGKLRGDCTDTANAITSMLRALGHPAKGVFGYTVDTDSPHAWVEVVIGGKPYIVDERGQIQGLEQAVKAQHLIRPTADDPRAFGWDETGQQPYVADWWTTLPKTADQAIGDWSGTLTFTTYEPGPPPDGPVPYCNSSTGLPIGVPMTMKVSDLGEGQYLAQVTAGPASCHTDIDRYDTVTSEWVVGGPRGSDVGGLAEITGRTVTMTDPQGTRYSGRVSPDGATMVGRYTQPRSDGSTLSGTWLLTKAGQ